MAFLLCSTFVWCDGFTQQTQPSRSEAAKALLGTKKDVRLSLGGGRPSAAPVAEQESTDMDLDSSDRVIELEAKVAK